MLNKTNLKLGALILSLLLVVGALNLFISSENKNIDTDPVLKTQGEMLDQLSLLSPEELAKIPKRSGIDLAMLQDFKKTKDLKLGYVPVERKIEAFKIAKDLLEKKNLQRGSTAQEIVWNERGPKNVGGRTRAIMFDPNDAEKKKVWAGGVSGGLWFTNDITTDSQWTAIDNFMSNLAISCIAYDPSNTNTFYMGTGEGWFNGGAVRGAGIWKSTNGGSSWSQLSATNNSNFYYVQKVAVLQDGSILAATHSGIFKSNDGGSSWSNVLSGNRAADIEVAANGTIYASMGIFSSGTVHKSTNNGSSWSAITPTTGGQRIELAVAPSNSNVVYAVASSSSNSVQWFKKSLDGGATWSNMSIPPQIDEDGSDFTRGQAWYDLILGVSPNDANRVIVGGIDLHISADGGSTWNSVSHWYGGFGKPYVHADQHAIAFRPGSTTDVIFGNDGGVFYSNNANQTSPSFSHRVNGYNVTQFYSCASANNTSNTFLAGAQDNGTHLFLSEGINNTQDVYGGDGGFCFINQNNPNKMIVSYVYNNFSVSTDGGNTFNDLPSANDGEFINPADYDSNNDILYSAGDPNTLVRVSSVSSGGNATRTDLSININDAVVSNVKVSAITPNRLFIGTSSGEVYRIDNANATHTITKISTGIDFGGNISSIDVGTSENTLVATVSNYGSKSVYLSTNGGTNWQNKEGNLPDMPVRWALLNPENNNEVLIATEVGVWSTSDITVSSPSWVPASSGLANVRCDMLKYRSSDRLVTIATYGRGLFTSKSFSKSASFSSSKNITYTNTPINFTDLSGSATSWIWNFGDGNSSTEQNPVHSYAEAGEFEITLSINNGEASIKQTINILPEIVGSYTLANGGNFESNNSHFVPELISGTGFELGLSSVTGKNGSKSGSKAWVTGISNSSYDDNTIAYLYTPAFVIDQDNQVLEFYTRYDLEDEYDGFIVEYSINKGDSWTQLGNSVSEDWYNSTSASDNSAFISGQAFFSDVTGAFIRKSFTLDEFLNKTVAFRFVFKSDGGLTKVGAAIDDFQIIAEDLFLNAPKNYVSVNPIIYPNPSKGVINILLENEQTGLVSLQIFDQNGRLLRKQTTIKTTGSDALNLDLSSFAAGNYILKIMMSGYQETSKFIIN